MMILQLLLVVCSIVRESLSTTKATPQPTFNPRSVVRYRAPEPSREDLSEFRWWNDTYDGVDFMGFLFAGRAEFPWVVHIRDEYDQMGGNEFYSIGNLISNHHVLTVCRAVTRSICRGPVDVRCQDEPGCPCPRSLNTWDRPPYLEPENASSLFVFYFQQNSYQEGMIRDSHGQYIFAYPGQVKGRVGVLAIILHPKCSWDLVLWDDMAVLVLKKSLPYLNRWVGIIQVPIKNHYLEDDDRLKYVDDRQLLCYVATVGFQPLYGLPFDENTIVNYKVKYRVYPVKWLRCQEDMKFICRGLGCLDFEAYRIDITNVYRIECWQTRNRVGTVCDRDRGAPVVCEGKVEGFVIRGALRDYCNPGIQLPFMIQRVAAEYPEFLDSLKFNPVAPLPLNPLPTMSPRAGSPHNNPLPFMIFLFIFSLVNV